MKPNEDFRRALIDKLPRLRRFAGALCRAPLDPDDLVQVTCERALARWQQFEPGTRIESWLFSIMHSQWKNELRRAANKQKAYAEARDLTTDTDGERVALGKISLDEVLSALKQLPADQAAAITAVNLEGLSYREAAEALDVPQGTLESRIARGRLALGRILESPNWRQRAQMQAPNTPKERL